MKVKVVSDLHLEFCEHGQGVPDLGEGNILILGGDILCARHLKTNGKLKEVYNSFLYKCVENFDRVLFIPGNHEFYGHNYEGTLEVLRTHLNPHIDFLHDSHVIVDDWVFIGCTLWTDFNNESPLEMLDAEQYMNDYRTIRIGSNFRTLRSSDTLQFHRRSKQYIFDKCEEFKDKNIWVLTHHGPSRQSIPYRFIKSVNGAYVSDLDDSILGHPQIKYWSHGHTHDSFDYKIGDCRIVCNPRGYWTGVNSNHLNPNFNPNFEVEL
jgi:hypothetical protein